MQTPSFQPKLYNTYGIEYKSKAEISSNMICGVSLIFTDSKVILNDYKQN